MLFFINFTWFIAIVISIVSSLIFFILFQSRVFKTIKKLESFKKNTNFTSLLVVLGGKVGVGSIAGMGFAYYYGGPGSLFWMWLFGILFSINTFSEVIFSKTYLNQKKEYFSKKSGIVFTFIILVGYVLGFTLIQSNTVVTSVQMVFNVDKKIIASVISVILFFTFFQNKDRVIKIISYMVVLMLIFYIMSGVVILFLNHKSVISTIINVFQSAFNVKSFIGSFIPMIILSVKKVVFATESGAGICSLGSSESSNKPLKEGYIQTLGVFISLTICTLTFLIIGTSNINISPDLNLNGIELVFLSFSQSLGNFGIICLLFVIILFALSTIITLYYYGVICCDKLKIDKKKFRLLILAVTVIGGIFKSLFVWNFVDTIIPVLLVINVLSLIKNKSLIYNAVMNENS